MTKTYAERAEEDRRLIVLRALVAEPAGTMNERLLQDELQLFGHRLGRDQVRETLRWLETAGAITLRWPNETIMVADITRRGEEHVSRAAPIAGIALPSRG